MSKNIVIQEGGVGKQLTADKLKTNLVSGGTCLWVPEEDVQLTTKTITKNGTYKASKDGYYGYDKVIVNVAGGGSISGKGADGNEYSVDVDENGNIVETKIPSSIRITTPPTYTGPYGDRAYISFDGLVVTAYDVKGNSMGEVPFDELVFPVTVTDYSSVISGIPYNVQGMTVYATLNGTIYQKTDIEPAFTGYFENAYYPGRWEPFLISDIANGTRSSRCMDSGVVNYNGGTFYYTQGYGDTGTISALGPFMGTLYYGDSGILDILEMIGATGSSDGKQHIPVQWIRSDGKTLETNFGITVVNTSPSGGESGGGSTVDDGHGGSGGSF